MDNITSIGTVYTMSRSRAKTIKLYTLIGLSIFLLIVLYFEIKQAPSYITEKIRQQFEKAGYILKFKDCYLRPWGFSEFSNFTLKSKNFDATLIGKSLKLDVDLIGYLFFSKSICKSFFAKDITLIGDKIPPISKVILKGNLDNHLLHIKQLKLKVYGIVFDIQGTLNTLITQNYKFKNNLKSSNKITKKIRDKITEIRQNISELNKDIFYNIKFNFTKNENFIDNNITIPSFTYKKQKYKTILAHFSYNFKNTQLEFKKLNIKFPHRQTFSAKFSTNIKKNLFSTSINSKVQLKPLLNLVDDTLLPIFQLYIPKFAPKNFPIINLNIKNAPLNKPLTWNISGNIQIGKSHLNKLLIKNGKCIFEANLLENRLSLTNIHLTAKDFFVKFDLLLDFKNQTLLVRAKGKTDPNQLSNFIWHNKKLKQKIKNIWEPFKWNKEKLPELDINFFYTLRQPQKWYIEPTITKKSKHKIKKDSKYQANILGTFKASDFSYNLQPIKKATGRIYITNDLVMLQNISANTHKGKATKATYIVVDDTYYIKFNSLNLAIPFLNDISGGLIPTPKAIVYTSKPYLEFNGIFTPKKENKIQLVELIAKTPSIQIIKNPIMNSIHQLKIDQNQVFKVNSFGNLFKGKILTNYQQKGFKAKYAFLKGQVKYFNIIEFARLHSTKPQKGNTQNFGYLFGDFDLQLDYDVPAKKPFNISGSAKAYLKKYKKQNLSFLEMIPMQSISSISKINTPKIIFKGQKVYFPKDSVKTDGGVFSLIGDGNYNWHTKKIDFKLRVRILKNINILPLGSIVPIRVTGLITKPIIKTTWKPSTNEEKRERNFINPHKTHLRIK